MCGIATMVTISDGQETFLVGCNDEHFNIAQIYKLVWQVRVGDLYLNLCLIVSFEPTCLYSPLIAYLSESK